MEMREKILLGALAAISAAAPAYAQSTPPSFSGSVSGTTTTATTNVASTSATTGDSTTAPYVNTVTTTQTIALNTTLASASATGTGTFNNDTFTYQITGSGTGSQNQTITTQLIQTYAPGSGTTPPTVVSSSSTSTGPTNVGSPTVSAVSVSGTAGFASPNGTVLYAGTLTSSGTLNSNGTVNVTENTIGVTTSGTAYASYAGTASFNPATGVVTVGSLTQTGLTTIGASGLATTGSVTAASVTAANVSVTSSLNMNGNRIQNVGTPTAATDAATKGYVDTAIAGVNSSLTSLNALVESNRKRSDAGIATAVALSGGTFLPNKKINFTANIGAFRDEAAIAAQLGVLVSENIALNAGVATSFHSYGGTAVRGGFTVGF